MSRPGSWRERQRRRGRRAQSSNEAGGSIRGLAFLLGVIMAFGLVVPPIVSRMWNGDTMLRWTWDFFDAFGEPGLPDGAMAGILFFVLAPFVGAGAAIAARVAPRGSLPPVLLLLGLVPIGCAIGGLSKMSPAMGAYTVVFSGAQMLLLAGAVVGAKRPDRPIGFRLAATCGSLMLVLGALPLVPGPGGDNISFAELAIKALDAKEFGIVLFVMMVLPFVGAFCGLTTAFGDQKGRRRRALAAAWIIVGALLLGFVVPMAQVLEGPPGSFTSAFFLLTSIFLLRMYPALALVVMGLAGLIFRFLPAETDLEEIFA